MEMLPSVGTRAVALCQDGVMRHVLVVPDPKVKGERPDMRRAKVAVRKRTFQHPDRYKTYTVTGDLELRRGVLYFTPDWQLRNHAMIPFNQHSAVSREGGGGE